MQRLTLAIVLAISGLLLWAAPVRADRPTSIVDLIRGEEQSTGTIDGNVRRGVRFTGTATGTLPGTFEVTVDYTPARPVCGGANRITGGTFSLNTADGTLTGRIVNGGVAFDPVCLNGVVTAGLVITGGTGAFQGARGQGSFSGLLDHTPIVLGTGVANLTGTVELRVHTPRD